MSSLRGSMKDRCAEFTAIILFAMLLWSCSDDPTALNSVGTQLLSTKVTVKTDILPAVSSSTFRQYVSMDGRTNLIGKFSTSNGEYVAYGLVQFFSSYIFQRDTVLVLSATLKLRAETWFGDSSASFGFNVHEINRSWGQTTFRWDSLEAGFYNPVPGPFPGSATQQDSQWISVGLDTAMVRRWLRPSTFSNNYGVILIPTQGTNIIRGIHAFEFGADTLYPQLTVIARNVSGTTTDTTIYQKGQDTFVTFVGNINNPSFSTNLIYVQSGVSYRGFLKVDLSSIPRGAIINQAQLTLVYNPAASRVNRFTTDSSIVVHSLLSATDSSKFELLGARAVSSLSTARFVFDIRHQVQTWIRDQRLNYGVIFRPTNANEFSSFDLFAFYNETAADSTARPQLLVKYTVESK
ncbi:MAG: TGFb propeptide protein [Bacteroidetes bacterium]|nr:TGFb propeptide protein [Bacteroidota bacterium]